MSGPRRAAAVAAMLLLVIARPLVAQEWRVSAQVGRVTAAGAPAGSTGNSSAVLGVSRTAARDWLGVSAALPVNGDPFWVSGGGWKRLSTRGAVGVMLDLGAHGFVQRYTTRADVAPAPSPLPLPGPDGTIREVEVSGAGVGGEVLGGAHALAGPLRVELRGGAGGQRSTLGGNVGQRILPTGDARLTLVRLPAVIGAESRGWWKGAERHTYAGGSLRIVEGPVQLWGMAGNWVSGGIPGIVWGAGGRAAIGPIVELEVTARGNGFDPIYLTTTGTSLAVGVSLRVGRGSAVLAPIPARYENGRAEITIPARDTDAHPSIAGDFTGWTPAPMERDGSRWVWRGRLAPGTYHYAFVAADGTWFVPESVPGRRDDGMGGHVAVLVVAP